MLYARRMRPLLLFLPLTIAEAAQSPNVVPDCLFDGPRSELPGDCTPDPYGIAREPEIVRTLESLGFQPGQVTFFGCVRGRFSTWKPDTREMLFRVNYPLGSSYRFQNYVGPISHELGHAIQLREAGSVRLLREGLGRDSSRIELGADFLAGLIFRRQMTNMDQQGFEQSLDLLGNYRDGTLATHSTPEARTAAFRTGFHYRSTSRTPEEASTDFQRNIFAAIVREIIP